MKNYLVEYRHKDGTGGTYTAHKQDEVLAHVKRLIECGTKYVGDKVTTITIRRRSELQRKGGGE
jgi:ribosomal protein L14